MPNQTPALGDDLFGLGFCMQGQECSHIHVMKDGSLPYSNRRLTRRLNLSLWLGLTLSLLLGWLGWSHSALSNWFGLATGAITGWAIGILFIIHGLNTTGTNRK